MVRELQAGIVDTLNMFPSKDGVYKTESPGTIIDGRGKPNMNMKSISFGNFPYVYTDTDNTTNTRSILAISLRSSNYN